VSEPTIRVEVLDDTDTVIDAFQRTIYGVTIEPGKAYWFRVDGDLTADVAAVADVHIELAGANCKSTWH
jgi:regulation of enolase protein 1 (concanavalin A-like superfamily)